MNQMGNGASDGRGINVLMVPSQCGARPSPAQNHAQISALPPKLMSKSLVEVPAPANQRWGTLVQKAGTQLATTALVTAGQRGGRLHGERRLQCTSGCSALVGAEHRWVQNTGTGGCSPR